MSPTRAAGCPQIITVADAFMMTPGPAGMQPGSEQGAVMSPIRAAGLPPISTVTPPGGMMASGKAGCGVGVGTRAAGWIGAWQCGADCKTLSPTRAAGAPMADLLPRAA